MINNHPLSKKYASLFNKFNVNTHLRLSHFFAQIQHESGLKPIEENLRYTSKRLLQVFPKYFKTSVQSDAYSMQPQKIANRVYSNRMGNGDESSGDGWKYRGRGFIQLTGKNNYTALTKWANANGINADYVKNPDLLLTEADALISALWYWDVNNINRLADRDSIEAVTKAINGGLNGLNDRKNELSRYKNIFSC